MYAGRLVAGNRAAGRAGLRQADPAAWPDAIRAWADRIGLPVRTWRGVGISLAVPLVRGRASDRTRKLKGLDGVTIRELRAYLSDALRVPVSIVPDGVAALLGEFAANPGAVAGSSGMLTFGHSIGFGWAHDGDALAAPYTSWVSHLQLHREFAPSAGPCPGCGQHGCWRTIYQALKGIDAADPKAESLTPLLEYTAQGVAAVLNVLPMDRLFLGGGWARHNLHPEGIRNDAIKRLRPFDVLLGYLKSRILVEPEGVLRLAAGGAYGGAVGAAWQAYRDSDAPRGRG